MKKLVLFFSIILFSFAPCTKAFAGGFTPPFELTAKAVYVYCPQTKQVVYEKNANEKSEIASLTQLMTALLLIENIPSDKLDTTILTAPSVYTSPVLGNAKADIRPNEELSARSLLSAIIVSGANEAAHIAALYIGKGNLENFYLMMNARAKGLGCKNTLFLNEHGLYDVEANNYSTAYDVYLILAELMKHEAFKATFALTSYTMPSTNKHSAEYQLNPTRNGMLRKTSGIYRTYTKGGLVGVENGKGTSAEIVAAENNSEFISIILNSESGESDGNVIYCLQDAAALNDWIIKNFSVRKALEAQEVLNEIPLQYSRTAKTVKVCVFEDVFCLQPNESDISVFQKKFDLPAQVQAPIKKGEIAGSVKLILAGNEVAAAKLVFAEEIKRDELLYAAAQIKAFFTSLYFKVVITVSFIAFVAYLAATFYLNKKRKRY